ncbi:MAG: hypothetical protein ACTSW1_12590 [Candidatus Hodarchaeales archaeon]
MKMADRTSVDNTNLAKKTNGSPEGKAGLDERQLHPLEQKYGKEPRVDPKDLWSWH